MADDSTPRPATRIRPAAPADVPALHHLICELAWYEREPDAVEASPEDLRRALFARHPLLHALVAEVAAPGGSGGSGGFELAGMALWFVSYSTWRGRHGIWLEDLFVRPVHRRLGLGRALLAELAAEAVARGYARLEWNVLDWNEPALSFYARLGAEPLTEWTVHRLADGALRALAEQHPAEQRPAGQPPAAMTIAAYPGRGPQPDPRA
jgi:GNAT superfamily N-acetyltransferase